MEFKLTSPAFSNGAQIPSQYTCDGDNISPFLVIHGPPPHCKSLALIMADLDAPERDAVHWVLWNINPEVPEIREHSAPHGSAAGLNSAGRPGYRGPCPDTGIHRYLLRLFALDIKLKLADGATREELERAMEQHILATAELGCSYQRSNEAPV